MAWRGDISIPFLKLTTELKMIITVKANRAYDKLLSTLHSLRYLPQPKQESLNHFHVPGKHLANIKPNTFFCNYSGMTSNQTSHINGVIRVVLARFSGIIEKA